ncbi:MAG: type III pantothenate kinase [Elusimicrobia bacterium]|nr:type III pantothenate kinase [Elusimicrobiota bacterium]
MTLLAIDIGNTTINIGLFSATKTGGSVSGGENKMILSRSFLTKDYGKNYSTIGRIPHKNAIISSVVPDLTAKVKKNLKNPYIVSYKNIPMKVKLKNPAQAGADRLVNAVAVKTLFGYPAIVIDMGTATTIDKISAKGEYAGGMIAPGLEMSVASLYEKTAKLPKIKLSQKLLKNFSIGKNTKEAILAGVFTNHIGFLKEAIRRIQKSDKRRAKIILTGGYADYFSGYIEHSIVDKNLTLKGLKIIFDHLNK